MFKEHMISRLIVGESSLAETVEVFERTSRGEPGYLCVLRHTYPGYSDYEKLVNNVLHHVELTLQAWPAQQRQIILARLQLERQQLVSPQRLQHH
jgi:hypothetical protein